MKRRTAMNKLVIAFVVVAFASAPALLAQPAAATFGSAAVAAGDTWTESSGYGSDIEFTLDNGMGGSTWTDADANLQLTEAQRHQNPSVSRVKRVQITGLQGHKIGGLEVEYTEVKINNTDVSGLFSGKKYAIDINGNHVNSVTLVGGGALSESEEAFVKRDNSNVGQARELRRIFEGETIRIGDSLGAKNPEDLFDLTAGFTVDSFSMTLMSLDGSGASQTATFQVSLAISSGGVKKHKNDSGSEAPFATSSLHFSLNGPLIANVSMARLISFDLSGNATAGGQKESKGKDRTGTDQSGKKGANGSQSRSMSISGTGTAFLNASYNY